jgi:hypothetical protein
MQINVFGVIDSLNSIVLISINTMTPIPKPITLDGHMLPSNAAIRLCVDFTYNQVIGIPKSRISQGNLSIQPYLNEH